MHQNVSAMYDHLRTYATELVEVARSSHYGSINHPCILFSILSPLKLTGSIRHNKLATTKRRKTKTIDGRRNQLKQRQESSKGSTTRCSRSQKNNSCSRISKSAGAAVNGHQIRRVRGLFACDEERCWPSSVGSNGGRHADLDSRWEEPHCRVSVQRPTCNSSSIFSSRPN
jgi:hypothetical protein